MTNEPFLLCCLNYEFYCKYSKYLIKDLFPKELLPIYDTIVYSHNKHKRNLTVDELKALHLSKHPTLTQANIINLNLLLDKLKEAPVYDEGIAEDILKETYLQHKAELVANAAIEIHSNKSRDFTKLRQLTQELDDFHIRNDTDFAPINVVELIQRKENNFKWSWCLPELQERLGNIGPGIFGIIAARPDAGKTAFHINFTWNKGGWLEQGAKVHVMANEEVHDNQAIRGITCQIGQPWDVIAEYPNRAEQVLSPIASNIYIKDAVGMTMDDLHKYCKENPVDILIIDQLDKITVTGEFSRTDERLTKVYEQAREIAKRYSCAVLGITQASNDAHDKLYYDFSCLAGSKTGKAAEADFVITIGMKAVESTNGYDDGMRVANLSKNKLTGNKNPVHYVLNHKLSRITP